MSELLFTNKSDLVAIADKIREKAGISDSLSFPQGFIDSINGISGQGGIQLPTDTLVGLENGYDVMFYDENNEGLAFYSIKQGHSINPPFYNCKAWQTSDGVKVVFPYTPSADVNFYADNRNYASMLYDFYGLDSAVYPYLDLYVSPSYVGIVVGTGVSVNSSKQTIFNPRNYQAFSRTALGITDYSDIGTVLAKVMETLPTLSVYSNSYTLATDNESTAYHYSNFELTTTAKAKYRLDE